MRRTDRRSFLAAGAGAVGAWAVARGVPTLAGQQASVLLTPGGSTPSATVPANFLGFGYEMSSVAPLGLLSVENHPYVQLMRNLGPEGVLRFGGIVADFTRYQADGRIVAEPKNTVITEASLRQVAAFLRAVGWKAIWSVNFGQGSLPDAVVEARAVAAVLGDRLLALELGNEVENYGKGQHPLRRPPYDYASYRAEYERWHRALTAAVPGLRFAAPDTAADVGWVERMAADAHGEVQLLTTHYYRNAQQHGSAAQLQQPDPELQARLDRLRAASERSGIPWRMCETNSFSGGGLPGVSDSVLGALWTLDYCFLLAANGCAGVNLETGVNQLGFVSSYSPVQDDGQHHNRAGTPYYGVLAFVAAIQHGREILPLAIRGAPLSLTVYAVGRGGKAEAVVVVHRAPADSAEVSFEAFGWSRLQVQRLAAIEGASVTFGSREVTATGQWTAAQAETLPGPQLRVPAMSAAVVFPG